MSVNLSSDFGWRTHPVTGERQFHKGIDLPNKRGTPIVSATDGHVVRVDRWGQSKNWHNGNAVLVKDARGYTWAYLHLDRVLVAPGDTVKRGQQVGTMGNTGRTTALARGSAPAPSSWGRGPMTDGAWPLIHMTDGSAWWFNPSRGIHLHLQVMNPAGDAVDPKPFFPTTRFV